LETNNTIPKWLSWLSILTLSLLVVLLSGCGWAGSSQRIKLQELKMAPLAEMPDYVQTADPEIQQAYQFAVANPETLEHIPCYCGCNSIGHTSNLECYVDALGEPAEFDNHGAFCGVCIDITQDVMRLTRDGKELAEIRTYIDDKYSGYGPSTETEPVQAGPADSFMLDSHTAPPDNAATGSDATSCGQPVEVKAEPSTSCSAN